ALFVTGLSQYRWGFYPRGSIYNLTWIAVFAVMLGGSMVLMWRANAHARTIAIAFAVGCLALIDVLPVVGVGIRPIGFVAILGFVGIAANSIWRYNLIELTPEYAASQILATMKSAVIVIDLEGKIRVA